MNRPRSAAAVAILVMAGCSGSGERKAPAVPSGALHGPARLGPVPKAGAANADLAADADPTVLGARLLPADLAQAHTWGEQPGGGTRAIVAGVRVVDWPDGSIVAAEDRLPPAVSAVTTLPERMGGGFLFTVGTHVWRADGWLSPARPLFTAPGPIGNIHVGLDRVYVRGQNGALGGMDPRTGTLLDPGSIPGSPVLGRIAALDAWRAVAVTDLRGAELTLDAGSTWRALALPIEPSELLVLPDSIAIGGMDPARQVEWWEVRSEGQVGRLAAAPSHPEVSPSSSSDEARGPTPLDASARAFGARPLLAAVEDGWPLRDGTALVARDGALARVRLSDGGLAETVADAFALRPSRCHPFSLSRPSDLGAFGFACGEPRGATVVYRWDPAQGRLLELRRFDWPREIVSSGNGGLAVRGPCDPSAPADLPPPGIAWCVTAPGIATWREIHFRGDEVDTARVVVLSDGRIALVRAPKGGDLSSARLTLTDGTTSVHLPLIMPELRADVARALRLGIWMDGFEERRPGVLGGWVDAGGAVVGVEIDLDGQTRVGEYLRDAGAPFVSGRFGFGWTASRRGFETTDGGMTWHKELEMPDPIASPRDVGERACGPVGCLAAGWVRVGWGAPPTAPPAKDKAPPPRPSSRDMPGLNLVCSPMAGPPPVALPVPRRSPKPLAGPQGSLSLRGWMTASAVTAPCAADMTYFQGHPGPLPAADECGVQLDASASLERPLVPMGLSHIYAWGSRTGDWDPSGRWKIAWLWPWGGWPDARASLTTSAPWGSRDAAAHFLGLLPPGGSLWTLMPSDDPEHALLLARRSVGTRGVEVFALEADKPPVPVHRPTGEPFAEVQGATRVSGRWVLATAQSSGELPSTVLWSLDGTAAREIARLPRVGGDAPAATRLAHRTDGGTVGLVVEGQSGLDRATPPRWVVAVDLESRVASEPEPLSPVDLADPSRAVCSGDDEGWLVDLPYTSPVQVQVGTYTSTLQAPSARVRVWHTGACIERVTGSLPRDPRAVAALTTPTLSRPDGRVIEASVYASAVRYGLRCSPTR